MQASLNLNKSSYRQIKPYLTHLGGAVRQEELTGSNCYVLGDGSKRTLIDTAEWPEERADFIQSLKKFLDSAKVEIDKIFITNAHTEHFGGLHSVLQILSEHQKEMPQIYKMLDGDKVTLEQFPSMQKVKHF
mmetsp:Transcript_106720/g.147733  ORF Transcript_106720/g.147733 Transcript_106720/m.147733 type:complete len:132 (-) Transcript_106720:611-1006(-)